MKNCMAFAKVCRVRCQYIVDCEPDERYVLTFYSLRAYHEWLHSKVNENKTVLQICIHYDYPETI